MQCPVCRLDLAIVELQGVELDVCVDGHGLWFDRDELAQLFERARVAEELADLEQALEGLERARSARRCPRCAGRMDQVAWRRDGAVVTLDRCPHAHGLWFDRGELEQLLRAACRGHALARVQGFLRDYCQGWNA
ncbi:MAG: hypothetical protein EYC70_15040 [Planctomycetota bacterium]|nr:MAG: hypothetical protein EYC70_15040 [Planctomycetota bacterium]